ncbi:integrin alpha-3b [Engraulis encrasicolus]|uniref:integrin alpha-3b n=1 Tax=Engraulis encrasicolus TaxID=184585 RepID=UPI002FD08357
MAPSTLHLCLLAAFATLQTGCGFNIDVRFPVIKEGKTKGSLFGFSVAQHSQTQNSKQYLLLVGAPKERAHPQVVKVNETGAVYSCPISLNPTDCSRMDLVSSTDSNEIVEGMWLGVTVASQRRLAEGRVLACGHRYVKLVSGGIEGQRSMVGKCFVRSNDLTFDPLDDWQTHTYEACNPNEDHNQEGLCNMGIAAGMTETDVYMGAPGSYTWQGNVHVTWRDPNPLNSWDFIDKDIGKQDRKSYNYMGYSVLEEKKLLSRDEDTLVTGAPREADNGTVTLAKMEGTKLIPVTTLIGEQLGSYFGSSIAVTDLNNDDWNDLIVGAPNYFDRKDYKGGAVYVYMNENGSFQKKPSMSLYQAAHSAFGTAVAAIGDVNQDGFQDFAVGAPFEGSGKVYIWMGSMKGILTEPSQVIEGTSVDSSGFKTFGYSLSGGLDMDDNMYPDILVGSLDDRVALLRARPVVHLSTEFDVEPKIVDPSQCGDPCIKVKVCFSFTLSNGKKDFKRDITVNYVLEADAERRLPRVRFVKNGKDTIPDGKVSLSSRVCEEYGLSVIEPVVDKLPPVVFSLNISLHEQKAKVRKSLQNLDAFPILSNKQIRTEKTEINFQKDCGADNRCTSNLQLTATVADENFRPFPRDGSEQVMEFNSNVKKVVLQVVVTNYPEGGREAEDAHQAKLNITFPPSLLYSGIRADHVDCEADPNSLTSYICELGNPVRSNEKVELSVIFETAGINLFTEKLEYLLQLDTLSFQSDLEPVAVPVRVENTILASFSIEKPIVHTSFSGTVMGESAMNSSSDVGSLVEYKLKVGVNGEPLGSMGTLVLEFEWPFEVTNGKWLLYLTEIVTKGTEDTHCVPPGDVVNMLNLTLSEERSRRQRRDAQYEPPVEAAISILGPRKETFLLECSKGSARCVTFSCPLRNMSTYAEVIVRARVWNGTMLEDYINADRVTVRGEVRLRLQTDKPTIKMDDQDNMFTLHIDPEIGEEIPYEVPFWIFIIAGAAGMLLLGIIILILYKCGFFKRASRREMYEAKSQKAEIKIQPSETERLTDDY